MSMVQPGRGAHMNLYSPSLHSSDSATQTEPNTAATAAGVLAAEQASQQGRNASEDTPDDGGRALQEPEAARPQSPTDQQIIQLLNAALESAAGARLIVAAPQYPEVADAGQASPIARLPHAIEGRVTFAVAQTHRHADVLVRQPLSTGSVRHVCYEITFVPGSDRCLFKNWSDSTLYLKSFPVWGLPILLKTGGDYLICPGHWKVCLDGNGHNVAAEIWLRKRQFSVAIYKTNMAEVPTKRAAGDDDDDSDDDENPVKRRRLDNARVEKIAASPLATPAVDPNSVALAADLVDVYQLLQTQLPFRMITSYPGRETGEGGGAPFLSLAETEMAVVRYPFVSTPAVKPSPMSTPAAVDTYCLTRIRDKGLTTSSIVLACEHSALSDVIVAKVPRFDSQSLPRSLPRYVRAWKRETASLSLVKHRNIVTFMGADARMLALYLECLPPCLSHGNLNLTGVDLSRIFAGITSALAYLEGRSVVHNDIKPNNIAYSPGRGPVLFDFGESTRGGEEAAGATIRYLPPDVLRKDGIRGHPGDVWAFAITMAYVSRKMEPADFMGPEWMLRDIQKEGVSRKRMLSFLEIVRSRKAKLNTKIPYERILHDMLHWEAKSRITADEIAEELGRLKLASSQEPTSNRHHRMQTRSRTKASTAAREKLGMDDVTAMRFYELLFF